MSPPRISQIIRLLLLSLCCLGGLVSSVSAQRGATILNNPYGTPVVHVPSPYWGYTYSYSSWGDALHGAADVVRSQGQFLINKQQASILREKAQQEKLVTRRKDIEQWAWEREFKNAAWEKERERLRQAEIERDRTDPPLTQILAANSLNLLLVELKQRPHFSQGESVQVRTDWLPHIHVSYARSGTGGNVGLLKGDHISWPLLLQREDFTHEREEIEKLLTQAKQEALKGTVKAQIIVDARGQVNELERRLFEETRRNTNDLWTASDFVRAKRALGEFRSALQMLERPDAKYYLQPLQGETIAELVQYMSANGLSFAPATTGGERAYVALRQALAKEHTRVRKQP
jgi:hypothetical protein